MRLRYGYFVTCTSVVKDANGQVTEMHCTYDPATRGGNAPDGRKVKSTIHWVSAEHAIDAEVRLYDTLFTREDPNEVDEGQEFTENLNPKSLEVVSGAKLEPSLHGAAPGSGYQFERLGYFSRRSGHDAGEAGVQSHGGAARYLGQDRKEVRKEIEMIILGLGGILNDAACAVLKDGELLAAVEERKVARQESPGLLPEAAIATALGVARLTPADVNCIALVRPFAQEIHLTLRSRFPSAQVVMVEHHAAHAASAYYPSPFDDATVLTLDRDGDFRCGARWRASGNQLQLEKELYYPDSLGDLYSRVTELLGFNAGADEHKVQWLSTAIPATTVSTVVRGDSAGASGRASIAASSMQTV